MCDVNAGKWEGPLMRRLPYLVFLLANLGLILPRAIAQCDVAVTSFTVSASAVVCGSTDTGVGTFTVSIGPNCPSSMGVAVDSSGPDVYLSQTLLLFLRARWYWNL